MSEYYSNETECARYLYRIDDLQNGEFRTVLAEVSPKPGFWLYEIKAHYDKTKDPNAYYFFAKSKRDAKKRFSACMSWLTIRDCRFIRPGEEADRLLINPERLILY